MMMMMMRVGSRGRTAMVPRAARFNAASVPAAVATAMTSQQRSYVETTTDPQYWRTPEKDEIKRKHPGIPLGSQFARIKEQGEKERELVERDQFTDWPMIYRFSIGVILVLLALNALLLYGEPPQSPEYTPYVKPTEENRKQPEGSSSKLNE